MEKARQPSGIARSTVIVRSAPGNKSRAFVRFGAVTVPAAIGRSGRTISKREGDGATPIASMELLYGFMRGDRIRLLQTSLPMKRTRKEMLWCDEPKNANYNRLVEVPFAASHEKIMRSDGLYDICLVLDWNIRSRRRDCGSAIFVHLIKPGYEPTAGCIAIGRKDMVRLMRFVRKGTRVKVI